MRPKFYTLPPIPWPYVLINANRPKVEYVRKHRRDIKSVIIDSGVEIFRDPSVKDYPRGWFTRLINLYGIVKSYVDEVYVTVPDFPDDYNPRSLWIDGKTNIERTVDNIVYALDHYGFVNWLIPVQGHNRDPRSIERSVGLLEEAGVLQKKDYYAIANLCVEPRTDIIAKTVSIARGLLPNKKIHVFGIKLEALKYVGHLIDSFDSFAWTRPVTRRIIKKRHSYRTKEEAILFFEKWVRRLDEILREGQTELEV